MLLLLGTNESSSVVLSSVCLGSCVVFVSLLVNTMRSDLPSSDPKAAGIVRRDGGYVFLDVSLKLETTFFRPIFVLLGRKIIVGRLLVLNSGFGILV